jgi:hypothetical protein
MFCVVSIAWAQTPNNSANNKFGDVRGFVWGLSPDIIQENEKANFIIAEDNRMLFRGSAFDMPATMGYEFTDNKLSQVKVFIEKAYMDQQKRIDDLMTVRAELVAQYGEPIDENFNWLDRNDIISPDSWGWSVYRGELFITIKFQNQQSDVSVFLGNKQPYTPQLVVTYERRKALQTDKKEQPPSGLLF